MDLRDQQAITTLAKAIAHEVVRELWAFNVVTATPPPPSDDQVYHFGDLVVDVLRHEKTLRGKPLALKPREFTLLATLARFHGRVLTRAQLLGFAWPPDASVTVDSERTIDVHVRRLRVALGRDAKRILTIHAVGYKLDDRADV